MRQAKQRQTKEKEKEKKPTRMSKREMSGLWAWIKPSLLYSESCVYSHSVFETKSQDVKTKEPHIFTVANRALNNLVRQRLLQLRACVLDKFMSRVALLQHVCARVQKHCNVPRRMQRYMEKITWSFCQHFVPIFKYMFVHWCLWLGVNSRCQPCIKNYALQAIL